MKEKKKLSELKAWNQNYHISEIFGIMTALVMAVISYIPIFHTADMRRLAVVLFFLTIFAIRLWLFLWNRKICGTNRESQEQSKMMLASAVIILLMHSTFLIGVLFMLRIKEETPLMASSIILAVAYGVFTFFKIVMSVRSIIMKRRMNQYIETLSYIGWISAVYTLSLFIDYILIATGTDNYLWPRYLMVSVMGLTTFFLGIMMLVKSISALRGQSGKPL